MTYDENTINKVPKKLLHRSTYSWWYMFIPNRGSTVSKCLVIPIQVLVFIALLSVVRQSRNLLSLEGRINTSEYTANVQSSTLEQNHLYLDIPKEPYYDVQSILVESIGTKVLSNPMSNPLKSCSPTVQYQLIIPSPITMKGNDENSSPLTKTWTLQSYMVNSTTDNITNVVPKLYGGDEIYVIWEGSSNDADMGIANITDNNDGTYSLKFIRPPILQYNHTKRTVSDIEHNNELGRITVYLEYTCWIGSIFAPKKDSYARAGEVVTNFTMEQLPRPYIHDFIPPNSPQQIERADGTHRNTEIIDLSKYDIVIAFGDSLVMQMVRRYLHPYIYHPKIKWDRNVYQCLSNENDVRSILSKFYSQHGQTLINATATNKSVAILTGSASWDAWRGCVHDDVTVHTNAIRSFLYNVTSAFPHMDVYWKSPSAFFLHRYTTFKDAFNETIFKSLKPRYGVKPVKPRYINFGIPKHLYYVQKALMEELQIPFLDLYESYYLSAPWTVPGDCRHFHDELTRLQLSYFWPGLNVNTPLP